MSHLVCAPLLKGIKRTIPVVIGHFWWEYLCLFITFFLFHWFEYLWPANPNGILLGYKVIMTTTLFIQTLQLYTVVAEYVSYYIIHCVCWLGSYLVTIYHLPGMSTQKPSRWSLLYYTYDHSLLKHIYLPSLLPLSLYCQLVTRVTPISQVQPCHVVLNPHPLCWIYTKRLTVYILEYFHTVFSINIKSPLLWNIYGY